MSEQKRFEDWTEVDCSECERWWTSQCDGAKKGSRTPCNSFLATRSIVIPEQIKDLQRANKILSWVVLWHMVLFVAYVLLMEWL